MASEDDEVRGGAGRLRPRVHQHTVRSGGAKGTALEGCVDERDWPIRLEDEAVSAAAAHEQGGVGRADAVRGPHGTHGKSGRHGFQGGGGLFRGGSVRVSGLSRCCPEVVLEGTQSQRVCQQRRRADAPLVVVGVVVVRHTHLRHCRQLHTLHHMPRPGHAVLDGEAVAVGATAHLQQPLAGKGGAGTCNVHALELSVQPVLLIDTPAHCAVVPHEIVPEPLL
mmetsp:Transcript_22094/g.71115  ORF Transcript_22094/g.71115 Transcript_22094/m.71115 type:complete len:223 (-) Transcript_22094:1253-1921(-)